MNEINESALTSQKRWCVYLLLMIVSCGAMVTRISMVKSSSGETPFHSANDRSRWSTIRSLGDHNTYQLDPVIFSNGQRDKDWYTIDLVRHRDIDGREHYFSSKPTLLPTLLAYEYIVIKHLTGKNLADDTFFVAQLILISVNVVGMLILFVLLGVLLDRYSKSDWTRIFIMACATFGTFLTSYAITLNNHVIAAVATMVACYCLITIWVERSDRWTLFFLAGLSAAFAAANELPALSFLAAAAVVCGIRSPRLSAIGFLPGMLIMIGAFFFTNWTAHHSIKPPYTRRHDGPIVATIEGDFAHSLNSGVLPKSIKRAIQEHGEELGFNFSEQFNVEVGKMPVASGADRWTVYDPVSTGRLAIQQPQKSESFEIRKWGNWYDYDRSYWRIGVKTGVDLGEPSRLAYTIHVLVGHHGIFSLTPIWLLAWLGIFYCIKDQEYPFQAFGLMVLALSLVCILFYLARPVEDRNYGGVTSGLRWLFWFAPMWLVCMIPLLDRFAKNHWVKLIAILLLLASIASAFYSPLNPWVHPWLFELLQN